MNNKPILTKLMSLLTIAFFSLTMSAFAVSPPPDGGYANQNTAEGQNALFSLTTATENTAVGFHALYSVTEGGINTAVGSEAPRGASWRLECSGAPVSSRSSQPRSLH